MPRDDDSSTIVDIVTKAADSLEAVAEDVRNAKDEKATSQPLVSESTHYLLDADFLIFRSIT